MFLTFTNESKTGFENRKWNDPNRKWNYFSYFLISDQKTSVTKCFKLLPTSPYLVLETGNGKLRLSLINKLVAFSYVPNKAPG